jgi:hypothetical protein
MRGHSACVKQPAMRQCDSDPADSAGSDAGHWQDAGRAMARQIITFRHVKASVGVVSAQRLCTRDYSESQAGCVGAAADAYAP